MASFPVAVATSGRVSVPGGQAHQHPPGDQPRYQRRQNTRHKHRHHQPTFLPSVTDRPTGQPPGVPVSTAAPITRPATHPNRKPHDPPAGREPSHLALDAPPGACAAQLHSRPTTLMSAANPQPPRHTHPQSTPPAPYRLAHQGRSRGHHPARPPATAPRSPAPPAHPSRTSPKTHRRSTTKLPHRQAHLPTARAGYGE